MNIQNHFPVLLRTEQVIQKRVEKVRDEEKNKRQDLHVIATSYLGILKLKCSQLIPESEFHQVSEKTLEQEKAALNGDAAKNGKIPRRSPNSWNSIFKLLPADKKLPKDRERSEKKIIKVTAEREIKKDTPAREPSRDASRDQGREPTPREKSVRESRPKERESTTKERDGIDGLKKREKDKDARRREKRPTSPLPEFEGDLSSVSNSSNGSIQPSADLVIVEDQRGKTIFQVLSTLFLIHFSCICRPETTQNRRAHYEG